MRADLSSNRSLGRIGSLESPTTQAGQASNLCILCHGVMFGPGDSRDQWASWLDCLEVHCPDWIVKPLMSLVERAKFVIGDDIDTLAEIAATEVLSVVRETKSLGRGHLKLHCISHSMGGLVLRGALPKIFGEAPELEAGLFVTLSTPHLGVQSSWGAPKGMWRNYAWVFSKAFFFSEQVPQFSGKDRSATNSHGYRCPYLVGLSDPDGPYINALKRFKKRVCITMSRDDIVIPSASGSIWADRCAPEEDFLPSSAIAGWGFEAFSTHLATESSAWDNAQTCQWVASQDNECCFIAKVLDGLCTLDWHRVVVKVHLPNAPTVHMFLTGKKKDQGELEHCFSLECIKHLADMLGKAAEGGSIDIAAPMWVSIMEVTRPLWTRRASDWCDCQGNWVVATEEGVGNVKFYVFEEEKQAKHFFDSRGSVSRILVNPFCVEENHAGANWAAFPTIRRAIAPTTNEVGVKPAKGHLWIIGAEHGIGNVKFYYRESEALALDLFKRGFAVEARILFHPQGHEIKRSGVNEFAQRSVAEAFKRHHAVCASSDRCKSRGVCL